MRHRLLLLILLGNALYSFAQKNEIIPGTPEAASLAKFINFPVGYKTGVPDISIPLHIIKAGQLTLPVTLSYHAGGFKVDEHSGSVGLGWRLSTELQITRSVNGGDDFKPLGGGYFSNNMGAYSEDYDPFEVWEALNVMNNVDDWQPDRFQYSLLGKSGAFYFQKHNNGATPTAITVPYNGVRIEVIRPDPEQAHIIFKLTDTDGTVYWFGDLSYADPLAVAEQTINYSPSGGHSGNIVAWKCTKIISASKADTLHFLYDDKAIQYRFPNGDKVEVLDYPEPCQGGSQVGGGYIKYPSQIETRIWLNENTTNFRQLFDSVRLFQLSTPRYFVHSSGPDNGLYVQWQTPNNWWFQEAQFSMPQGAGGLTHIYGKKVRQIDYRGGRVEFNYLGDRLSYINIYSDGSPQVKVIDFEQSVINSCTPYNSPFAYMFSPTIYLDGVRITVDWTQKERYGFEYRNKFCFSNRYKFSDAWGGVNANSTDQSAVSSVPFQRKHSQHIAQNFCLPGTTYSTFVTFGNGNLQPDAEAMQSGILKKIIFPTGGFTEFEFGPNKFKQNGRVYIAGGLRVERIKYFDGPFHQAFEKIYKYGEDEDGIGILRVAPNNAIFDNEPNFDNWQYSQQQVYVERERPATPGGQPPFIWNEVATETKTTFLPNPVMDMFYTSGSPVQYTTVTEYQQDMGTETGKTVYEFDKDSYIGLNNTAWWPGTYLTLMESDWQVGQLKSETAYRYINGTYNWVKRKKYFYHKYELPEQVRVEQLFPQRIYWEVDEGSYWIPGGNRGPIQHPELGNSWDYWHFIYGIKMGCMLLTKEEESTQEDGREITQTTQYYYDNMPQQVMATRIETTNSLGNLVQKTIKYPLNYAAGITYIDNLKANYMLDLPIEEITQNITTGHTLAGIKKEYKTDNTGLLLKQYAIERGDNAYTEKIHFDSYDDRGNPLSVTSANNFPVSYIWDYNQLHPIAEVINAAVSDIAYTSFEADSKGNWAFSGPVTAGATPAGSSYYSLSGGAVSKTGLLTSREYIVSYWTTNTSPFWIAGSGTPTLLKELNGWRLYRHVVIDQTTITVSGYGLIDELRLHPLKSQMKTFAYSPFAGMTVQCDINNRFAYYEYDNKGRLAYIRDEDKHILKQFCYNYFDQPEDCTSN